VSDWGFPVQKFPIETVQRLLKLVKQHRSYQCGGTLRKLFTLEGMLEIFAAELGSYRVAHLGLPAFEFGQLIGTAALSSVVLPRSLQVWSSWHYDPNAWTELAEWFLKNQKFHDALTPPRIVIVVNSPHRMDITTRLHLEHLLPIAAERVKKEGARVLLCIDNTTRAVEKEMPTERNVKKWSGEWNYTVQAVYRAMNEYAFNLAGFGEPPICNYSAPPSASPPKEKENDAKMSDVKADADSRDKKSDKTGKTDALPITICLSDLDEVLGREGREEISIGEGTEKVSWTAAVHKHVLRDRAIKLWSMSDVKQWVLKD